MAALQVLYQHRDRRELFPQFSKESGPSHFPRAEFPEKIAMNHDHIRFLFLESLPEKDHVSELKPLEAAGK